MYQKIKESIAFVFVLLIIFSLFFVTGCARTESKNIKTTGLRAEIDLYAKNGNTEVIVDLDVGSRINGIDVKLSKGDVLKASANGKTKKLKKSSNLFDVEYSASFPFNDSDTIFKISLIRKNDVNAENSTVQLPSPIDIIFPFERETFTDDETVSIFWQPSNQGDTVKMEICYECTMTDSFGGSSTVSGSRILSVKKDPGILYYTVAGLINSPNPAIYDQGCEIELTLSRSRKGKLDSNFDKGGSIGAVQSAKVNFFYIPNRAFYTEY